MTAVELKKILIHRITEINDESFLNAVKTILDTKSSTQIIKLTASQRSEIKKSKAQIEQGKFIELSELDVQISKWLNAK